MTDTLRYLWGSKAEEVVRASFEMAQAQAETKRRDGIRRRLAIWRDAHLALLRKRAAELYPDADIQERILPTLRVGFNPLKRIVARTSIVYMRRARRWLRDPAQDAKYQAFAKEQARFYSLDEVLGAANWATNLCNTTLIRYQARKNELTGQTEPAIEVLTPDRFTVVSHPDDPARPVIVLYSRANPRRIGTHILGTGYTTLPEEWALWTPDEWRITDATGTVLRDAQQRDRRGANPLRDPKTGQGVLPFVAVHRTLPMDTFFDEASGQDLVDATLDIGVHAGALWRLVQLQSHLQPYWKRSSGRNPRRLTLGATSVLVIDRDDDFGVVNMQAEPEVILKAMRFRLADIAAAYGIPPDGYDLTFSTSSGFELALHQAPLAERRVEQVPRYARAEAELYRLQAITYPGAGLDPDAEFAIDHGDMPLVLDPMERQRLAVMRINSGFSSLVEEMMAEDPDLSREQAERQAAENLKARNDYLNALRAGNTPGDVRDAQRTPEENGALGPIVRDSLAPG